MLNNKQLECDILLEYYKNQIKKFGTYNILQLQSDCDRIYPGNMSKIYKPIKDKLDLLIKDKYMKRYIDTLTIKYNYENTLDEAKEIIREKLEEAQDLIDMIQGDEIEIRSGV